VLGWLFIVQQPVRILRGLHLSSIMLLLTLVAATLTFASGQVLFPLGGECSFTADCQNIQQCQLIADASCVCNFGKCIIDGNPFVRNSECTTYQDCDCKNDPKNCFCHDNACVTSAWECHESSECAAMEKCNGKECSCQSNICEWECDTTADCKDHYCNQALGYKCKCESSICQFEKKAEECSNLRDCISKKLCSAKKSCDCTQGYCEKPWWANEDNDCRNDQDCENSLGMCVGGKCACNNIKNISEYEKRGTCELK